ncbi:MAG: AlpA family phage regulatory protein [Gemmatimonadetes bacterium]|nr:AlpA family phage regulatory protein [Gemmatimonadota bacterium]MYG85396.1 AlpA family phage regulatory protein [Gemmatimonadota bacterium]MYJ89063.1 AlpA family phage regulatory protein [Gemmatimonadota bacterium]
MNQSDRLLTRAQVQDRLAISRSTLLRWVESGRFPKPVRLGERSLRWYEDEITSWIDRRGS